MDTDQEQAIRRNNLDIETAINEKACLFNPDVDLFKSKKELIFDYIKQEKRVRTSDIIRYGLSIYCNRGDRYGRELCEEGKIYRLRDDLKLMFYGKTNEDVYTVFRDEGKE